MSNVKLAQRLIPLWFLCYAGYSWAYTTFAQDVRSFDVESLLWSGAAGVFGGLFRTLFTMASQKTAVYDIKGEAYKDIAVALIAGLGAYVVMEGVNSVMVTYFHWPDVPRQFKALFILGAGWMRAGFFGKLDRVAATALSRVERQISGKDVPPTSEAMPLTGEK